MGENPFSFVHLKFKGKKSSILFLSRDLKGKDSLASKLKELGLQKKA